MWTPTTRQQHSRPVTRYQTDLTDAQWSVIAPHLPKPFAMGRPRAWPMREIINGVFYVMRAGCPWRLLPNDCRHGGRFTAGSPPGATTGALNGRPAKDFEATIDCARAFLYAASVMLLVRRIARNS